MLAKSLDLWSIKVAFLPPLGLLNLNLSDIPAKEVAAYNRKFIRFLS